MAEFVEYRTEQMLPELEQMLRINLFSKEEIRSLSKKTKAFEYKIERHTKCKEDFMNYIKFEINLLQTIKLRRDKFGIMQKKDSIDYAVARRINKLYKLVVLRYQNDVKIWLAYIKFCKNFGFKESVSQIMGRMLNVHCDKPQLWNVAAKWELDGMNSYENARQFLLRGIHIHKSSSLLFTELFKLQLEEAKNKNKQHFEEAEVVYSMALERVNDVEFYISLLNIAEGYEYTQSLQKSIVRNLIERNQNNEQVWHCVAQRELKGFHYDTSEEAQEQKNLRERIKLCVDVYQNAIKLVKTKQMWYYYVDTMLDLNKDLQVLSNFKRNVLGSALEGAHQARLMSEQHYIQWYDLLKHCEGTKEKILEIFDVATHEYPQCVELWQKLIHYHIGLENEEHIIETFSNARKGLGDKALPVWRQLLMYHQIGADSEIKVEEFFLEAIRQTDSISGPLKPLFLEWLALQKGIQAARSMYQKLAMTPPFCLNLHVQMSRLESLQIPPHIKSWRNCHEYAIIQFGKTKPDVWIEYIAFELQHGSPISASKLYTRAVGTLESNYTDIFETQYNLLKNGFRKNALSMEMP